MRWRLVHFLPPLFLLALLPARADDQTVVLEISHRAGGELVTGAQRVAARLSRLSFADAPAAARLLADEPLAWWDLDTNAPVDDAAAIVVAALGRTADPDGALEALAEIASTDDGYGLRQALELLPELRSRLLSLLGVSSELAGHLRTHPADWQVLLGDFDLRGVGRRIASSVGAV